MFLLAATFANSLGQQNAGSKWFETMIVLVKEFWEKFILKKSKTAQKHEHLS